MNRIPNSNNHGRINCSKIANPRHSAIRVIEPAILMRSMALKPTLIHWALTGNTEGPAILERSLIIEHSLIRDIRKDVSRMDDKRILAETNVILGKFLDTMTGFLKPGIRPNIVEFIKFPKEPVCVEQFYSTILSACGTILNNDMNIINQMVGDIKISYRKTLIFTIALNILSKKHDFTYCLTDRLSGFPLLGKVIKPINFLAKLDANELVLSGRLLNHFHDSMGVDFDRVIIDENASFDAYAFIKDGLVIINLKALPKIAMFTGPDIKNHTIIEK